MEKRKHYDKKKYKSHRSGEYSNNRKEHYSRFSKEKKTEENRNLVSKSLIKKRFEKDINKQYTGKDEEYSRNKKERNKPNTYSKKYSNDQSEFVEKNYEYKRDRFGKSKSTLTKGSPKHKSSLANKDDSIRLNRFLANAGICSRREADEYIKAGLVKVNGVVVTELGTKILHTDEVKFNNEIIKIEKKVYILLNKPKDYVTTTSDEHGRRTVMELIRGACREKVFPVGRLDRNTTGVLLFTNDGELAAKLTHPKYAKKKIYHVFLDKKINKEDMDKLVNGIQSGEDFLHADVVSYVDPGDKTQVGVEIHSGQNRVVRRMFEVIGYKVVKLDRVYFAGLTKKSLPRGRWRFLTPTEVNMLKMGAFE